MQQVKALDFTGKTIFCGIDVHKISWSVCLSMEDRIKYQLFVLIFGYSFLIG